MRIDSVKQFLTIHESLLKEKAALEARLAQINQALALKGSGAPAIGFRQSTKRPKRHKNRLSLRAAAMEATKAKPLSKREILAAIKKLGYEFTTTKPLNSLNAVLYSKRQFKNAGGKFSPA